MKKSDLQAAIDAAVSAALADQTIRIEAILRHPEAEHRRELAMSLALNSTLGADAAAALLKAAPKAASDTRDLWLRAMNAEGRIDLAADHSPVIEDARAKRLAEIKAAGEAVNARLRGVKGA